jgi:dTDP-4-amino-4,6-dideoxygalactose transaminase
MDRIPFLDLKKQHQALRAELLEVAAEAIDSAGFIGGAMLADFEADFARFTGTAHAIGVANGTDGLRLALKALGIVQGQPVVTVPNTFIATAAAISHAGGRIEFVDVDPHTCLMDPQRLEDNLRDRFAHGPKEDRPAAVIPVHLYGQCADMDAILAIAQRYGLVVLEDACQAHGATYKGRPAGSMGAAAAFSFYPGKNLGACGEAGAVTTNDTAVAETVRMLRDHGQKRKYHHQIEGYNARLDAMHAGFLRVKLRHLPAWNARRRELAARYDEAFARTSWLRPVQVLPGNVPVYHLYVIHAAQRDELMAHLDAAGISCGLHYPLPLHLQPCYARLGQGPGSFPHAERSAATLLSLPIFAEMESAQLQRVVEAVHSFGAARPQAA